MPKPITRVGLTEVQMKENFSSYEKEQQRLAEEALKRYLQPVPPESPEVIEKREKEKKQHAHEIRIRAEKDHQEWMKKQKNSFINSPKGSIKYGDHVRVSNKTPGSCMDEKLVGKTGIALMQNGCKCIHKISDTCYWIEFDDEKGNTHHFEECELEKI